ncbi:hypothetical protein [Fundidesulfovibrio agrisoli]|uniref:hypothetical protein n=1 Tax=Fundidesulfovibrio agrisoli TaxID=2922717 RepID=UPI001FAD2107|nr:hypothetical protein [Fundidesulfovibrio agrisoli]
MTVALTIAAVEDQGYRLILTHAGRQLLCGPVRPEPHEARSDAEALRRAVAMDGRYQLERDGSGGFCFRVLGEGGCTLAVSTPHPTPYSLGQAIATIKELMPQVELVLP